MTKHILITGGGGFLGSHLCERLLKDGHEVLCAYSCFAGTKQHIFFAKKELGWEPKVELDEGLKKTIEYFEGLLQEVA